MKKSRKKSSQTSSTASAQASDDTTPRKPGRPPSTGITKMRSLRISEDDWSAFRVAADAAGLPLAQWIVNTLRRALPRSTKRRKSKGRGDGKG